MRSNSKKCECGISEVTIHCNDCNPRQDYCEACFKLFHPDNARDKVNHRKTQLGPDPVPVPHIDPKFCTIHPGQKKKMVCMDCDVPVCLQCIVAHNEQNHKMGEFDKGFRKIAEELNGGIEDHKLNAAIESAGKEKTTAYLRGTGESLLELKRKVTKAFDDSIAALERRKEEFLVKIAKAIDERMEKMNEVDSLYKSREKAVEDSERKIKECKKCTCESYEELLQRRAELKRLDAGLNRCTPMQHMKVPAFVPLSLREVNGLLEKLVLPKDQFTDVIPGVNSFSSIVQESQTLEAFKLATWVSEARNNSKVFFQPLYKGSVDGFTALAFHAKCAKKSPTLTIIMSTSGQVFGGYTVNSWDIPANPADCFKYDDTAFLFSLTKNAKYPLTKGRSAIFCASNCGPMFGNSDIFIEDNCNSTPSRNYSMGSLNYGIPPVKGKPAFISGEEQFTVKEIEVYLVIDQ